MDSYDLFGEDGSGMLDGLPELGPDHFEPAVTGARNATSAYSTQPAYSQETPLQKLATFGGTDFNHMDPNAQAMYSQGYGTADRPMGPPSGGAYGHQRQMARPPPAPQPANPNQYPYQTDNMYSMPDHQLSGMADGNGMQATAWGQHSTPAASAPNYPMHRYFNSPLVSPFLLIMVGFYPGTPKWAPTVNKQFPLTNKRHRNSNSTR